jgi:beta-xylosidase
VRAGPRAGYWAVTTAAADAPLMPVLRSADLVHWRLVGSVLSVAPAWADGRYWAPEIRGGGGHWRVWYSAHRRGGAMCVASAAAASPEGPYRDEGPLVCQPDGSIDPTVAFDGRRAYLVWKEDGNSGGLPTRIWIQRLAPGARRLIGPSRVLLRGRPDWEGGVVEAPEILRHAGRFYLFYSGNACCGQGCRYAVGVARARRLLGPWRRDARNPVLAGNGLWRCPGHASPLLDPDGSWALAYHAYAAPGPSLARSGLLDRLVWTRDGWPTIAGPSLGGVL